MIENMIKELSRTAKPKYIQNYDNFNPEKDYVLYSGQYWDHNEIELAMTAFLTGGWIASGENVLKFQEAFAKKFNVGYSHMVNSGSSANLAMLAALKHHFKWNDGDEIIVSPVGFATTIAPIVQTNLKPIFIDIEFETLNFDVNLIEEKITSKTKAIFVSPVLANPPDMNRIVDICNRHNILLIGDNCDSLGTKWDGKLINELYFSWSCSFYPAHHISTGEGGMVSSNDKEFIETVRSISWWGRDCYCIGANNTLPCGTCGKRFSNWLDNYDGVIDHKYIFRHAGYNIKPLDLQGAIGLAQLDKIDEIEYKRRLHKNKIEELLVKYIGIKPVKVLDKSDPSWFGVPIVCESQEQKEFMVDFFESNRIQTRPYFAGNILLHPGFKHLDDFSKYPNSNKALSHVFFLGCPPFYNGKVFNYLEEVMKKW
jgi:CDP-6-deoxy-D-xylo-4-hexulose-3-dehydrase